MACKINFLLQFSSKKIIFCMFLSSPHPQSKYRAIKMKKKKRSLCLEFDELCTIISRSSMEHFDTNQHELLDGYSNFQFKFSWICTDVFCICAKLEWFALECIDVFYRHHCNIICISLLVCCTKSALSSLPYLFFS